MSPYDIIRPQWVYSWCSDAFRCRISWSTLVQAPSHYLNRCWLKSVKSCGLQLRANWQEIFMISGTRTLMKMTVKSLDKMQLKYKMHGNSHLKFSLTISLVKTSNSRCTLIHVFDLKLCIADKCEICSHGHHARVCTIISTVILNYFIVLFKYCCRLTLWGQLE